MDAAEAGRRQEEVCRSRAVTAMAYQTHDSERIIIEFYGMCSRFNALRYFREGLTLQAEQSLLPQTHLLGRCAPWHT